MGTENRKLAGDLPSSRCNKLNMDEMNLDASPGVLDYFWKLDQEIVEQGKKIRKQR